MRGSSGSQQGKYLQWSHDLSAMDTPALSLPSATGKSFNGAMTSQPWIPAVLPAASDTTSCAFNGAMTSQPWIRCCTLDGCAAGASFNGAMTSLPWIPISRGWAGQKRMRFNRAMTSQSWIPLPLATARLYWKLLQWSHDLSAMDTSIIYAHAAQKRKLQWSHDLPATDTPLAA